MISLRCVLPPCVHAVLAIYSLGFLHDLCLLLWLELKSFVTLEHGVRSGMVDRIRNPEILRILDDLLIWGEGETIEDAMADHDQNVKNLLERARAKNLKLNA